MNILGANHLAESWNRDHSVGIRVKYHHIIGEKEFTVHVTRSPASVLEGHTAVIFLEGISGCVALKAIEIL